MEDIIKNALSGFDGDCAEVRAQISTNHSVSMLCGTLMKNSRTVAKGVNARVFKDGYYGFASSCDYSEEAVKSVLKAAGENSAFLSSHLEKSGAKLASVKPFIYDEKRPVIDTPQKNYIDFIKTVDDYIVKNCPRLTSRTVVATADTMEKLLYTSFGTVAHTVSPRAYVYIFMSTEAADGSTIELFDVVNEDAGYFCELFPDTDRAFATVDSLYKRVLDKAEGIFPEAGTAEVILSGSLAGMLAHEAVGHTVEADLVTSGSVAGPALGKVVASEKVNMVDFAHTAFGKTVPLPVYVDDEGTEARDQWLIRDGILVGYMNNRESATRFDMPPFGNARAHTPGDEPLIRMRNTAILPGTDKLADMIASVEDGYYLTDTGNGQADMTGEFMFGITMGYEIKHGKLGRALRDTTISGIAFEMLKTVDMLSDTMEWSSSGYCGKKQLMPVSLGGPAVKCKVTIGGR